MKAKLKGLYGITSQDMLLDNDVLFHQVEQALIGGMSILQYRQKQVPSHQSVSELIRLKHLCHKHHALFIINDNVNLCLEVGADGVHLGENDTDIAQAKNRLGADAVIGVSCYNKMTIAKQAYEHGASYIAFGAFYASPTKPNAPVASINLIQQAKKFNLPICCIGGLSVENAPTLIKQGADMIAVVSELFNEGDIQSNAQKFTHCFRQV